MKKLDLQELPYAYIERKVDDARRIMMPKSIVPEPGMTVFCFGKDFLYGGLVLPATVVTLEPSEEERDVSTPLKIDSGHRLVVNSVLPWLPDYIKRVAMSSLQPGRVALRLCVQDMDIESISAASQAAILQLARSPAATAGGDAVRIER